MDMKKQDAVLAQKASQQLANERDPIERFKCSALKNGASSIKKLGRKFKIMDDSGDRRLNWEEFVVGCRECRISKMSEQELWVVFNHFDKDGSGKLDYDEFLASVRPNMNGVRKLLVQKAFAKMDKSGDGTITVDDLVGTYSPDFHPKYQNGEMTRNDVYREFLKNFEAEETEDGTVTIDEWMDYFSGVSASIDDDAYFSLMMYNCWGVKACD